MLIIVLLIIVPIILIDSLLFKPLRHWKSKSVPFIKEILPLIGNLKLHVTKRRAYSHILEDFYHRYPNERYVGIYQFLLPTLIIRDLELIKDITIKDFNTFPEHRTFVTEEVDSLFGKSIFAMKGGARWQAMRAALSPTFTSSKLKGMLEFMHKCAMQFTNYCEKEDAIVSIEMKHAFTKYTNDVIASAVFGVSSNSFEDPDNEIYIMGKEATDFSGIKLMKFMLFAIHPFLPKLLGSGIFTEKVSRFFRNLVKSTLKMRQERNIIRPDVLHFLTEAQKKSLEGPSNQTGIITDEDVVANALIFYIAGYDSSSTLLCFTCHELAVNPKIQQRLLEEIQKTCQDSELTYESLLGMKYLDQVISESMRKWPPEMQTDRVCVKPYVLDGSTTLDVGTNVLVPIFALHRDPKYWPDPLKFDPDRFSDDNKRNITPFTYLPFGAGPRICIASRFVLLQTKILLVETLRKFEIIPVEQTQIPLKLCHYTYNPSAQNGFWLGFKKRR